MRPLLLSLVFVTACGGDSNADGVATATRDASAGRPNAATAGCPITSSYAVDTRFQITAASRRSATGTLSSKGPTLETGIRDTELAPDVLAVALSNELGDTLTVKTLVIVRRTNGGCAPPTGNRVDTATALAPGSTEVITGAASPDSQTSAITVTVTGTTTTARQIRTPDFVLPIQ